MHRHRVRRESVDREDVEGRGPQPGDLQPRIAEDDIRIRRTIWKESEIAAFRRDPHHRRVDLEEAPLLAGLGIAGERSGSEADDADIDRKSTRLNSSH